MTHLNPSFWVHTTSKCSDKSSCFQTKAPREKLCFWDEDIAFLGHIKWSKKHSGNNQRRTFKDTRSQVLEAVNISAPLSLSPPSLSSLSLSSLSLLSPLSLCTQELIHKHCSPSALLTSRVYCVFVLYLSACVIHVTTVRTRSAKTVTQSNWLHRTSQLIYTWLKLCGWE